MTLKPIPLLRSAYLKIYITLLQQAGVGVESELNRNKLPIRASKQTDGHIPLLPALTFVHQMEQIGAVEDFGLEAGRRIAFHDLSPHLQRRLSQATTLDAALKIWCALAHTENSHAHYAMVLEGQRLKVTSSLAADSAMTVFRCSEWLPIMMLITVMRQFVGRTWCPTQIAFRSHDPLSVLARKEFPSTHFLVGQPQCFIELPTSLLGRVGRADARPVSQEASASARQPFPTSPPDFPSSLVMALRAYLCDGYPPIQLAATIVGTSIRTLQRRLSEFGLSYSELVQRARFEVATELLRNPDYKVLDTAYALGYRDPSHFARAFRRTAGISPRAFRTMAENDYTLSRVGSTLASSPGDAF
ncbi:MAG: helix-turn-helix domain-containing protein [Gammaproteobacteria bacterium]